jgi:hypothetical protein
MAKERVNLPRQRIETLDLASHKNFFKHCRDSTKSKNALYRRSAGTDGPALVNRLSLSELQERNPQFHRNCGYSIAIG